MNNQMPYIDPNNFLGNNPNLAGGNFGNQNFIWNNIERMNNRINRLERQFRILENRVNRLSSNNPQFLNSLDDDNNNMYMI